MTATVNQALDGEAQEPREAKKEEPGFFSYENLKSLAILATVILAIRWTIASPYHVPTPSMEPTIKVGDRLLVSKLSYDLRVPFTSISIMSLGEIKRGDIVVFTNPKDTSMDFVKRVVGLPGDRLRIFDDVLYINEQPQERFSHDHDRKILSDITDHPRTKRLFRENLMGVEHWTMNNTYYMRLPSQSNWPGDGTSYHVVPNDSIFVIGDNRDNSDDSRSWFEVPRSYVKGKAMFVLWSMFFPDPKSWMPEFRFYRSGHWFDAIKRSYQDAPAS